MSNIRIKITLVAVWGIFICLLFYIFLSRESSTTEIVHSLRGYILQSGVWGPLIYVVAYAFRSLVFFPASVLTITAGVLFGPLLGILLTIIGENISANISFIVGR